MDPGRSQGPSSRIVLLSWRRDADLHPPDVFGISTDSVESHKSFIENHKLPLRLLSDPDRRVADAYGARSLIPGKVARSVFVIDANGIIRYRDVRPIGLLRPKDDDIIQAIREAQQ